MILATERLCQAVEDAEEADATDDEPEDRVTRGCTVDRFDKNLKNRPDMKTSGFGCDV